MSIFGGVLALAAAAGAGSDVEALQQLWTGTRDSTEEVVVSGDAGINTWPESSERRVRDVIEPVALPWLGSHVLYLEEFLHDDPENLRRQLLIKLEVAEPASKGVRARLFTFTKPRAWIHLNLRPNLIAALRSEDIETASTCDLLFTREGDQFKGSTIGHRCLDMRTEPAKYLEYQILVGEHIYWYRRRLLRKSDNEVQEEVIGYNWFELNSTQLYTCRIDWTGTGRPQDLRPLLRLDVEDQGGHARFATPDGRRLELTLHSDDWPYSLERDSLILVLRDQGAEVPFATAWSSVDEGDVTLNLSWLRIRCGPVVPDTDELQANAAPAAPARRYPFPAPG